VLAALGQHLVAEDLEPLEAELRRRRVAVQLAEHAEGLADVLDLGRGRAVRLDVIALGVPPEGEGDHRDGGPGAGGQRAAVPQPLGDEAVVSGAGLGRAVGAREQVLAAVEGDLGAAGLLVEEVAGCVGLRSGHERHSEGG
jgi:hypothetical protein